MTNLDGDFTDAEAIAAIISITGGNVRLLNRLCTEIQRLLQINAFRRLRKRSCRPPAIKVTECQSI